MRKSSKLSSFRGRLLDTPQSEDYVHRNLTGISVRKQECQIAVVFLMWHLPVPLFILLNQEIPTRSFPETGTGTKLGITSRRASCHAALHPCKLIALIKTLSRRRDEANNRPFREIGTIEIRFRASFTRRMAYRIQEKVFVTLHLNQEDKI